MEKRIMWERHPDFRVDKLPNQSWRIKIMTPRAKILCDKAFPTGYPCDFDGNLVLDPREAMKFGRTMIENGMDVGDWA